ncbi:MAG: hypothetical protein E7218_00890 [Anaerofustis stercorihominis]|nr:hypothetical protein [Anaerofustis stercorihominis]
MKKSSCLAAIIVIILLVLVSSVATDIIKTPSGELISDLIYGKEHDISLLPEYTDKPYDEINNNIPYFPPLGKDILSELDSYEYYSQHDSFGRCGIAFAVLSEDTLPTEERTDIGMIRPSGWHTVRYDDIIEGKYLYNRCHLIGYQLSGENANEKNLITGTRYFNVSGMLPLENMTENYIKKTGNHVLYRVTPVFYGNDLVCRGVIMEAKSVEDHGRGLSFNVFVHNIQPGIKIDYRTGESKASD